MIINHIATFTIVKFRFSTGLKIIKNCDALIIFNEVL